MSTTFIQLPGGRIAVLKADSIFPPVERALREPNGLLAIGGELSTTRLLSAYSQGIFPWYSAGQPIMWWSPDPRMVLYPGALKVSRSLSRLLRRDLFEIRFNSAFRQVLQACAGTPRDGQHGTWITAEMIDAYVGLHAAGHAHSVEAWLDGQLVGGLYGVAIGRMFYGESMFHHVSNASKVAFVHLVWHLQKHGFGLIDCQMKTPHLASLGAGEIPRRDFLQQLRLLVQYQTNKVIWT